MCASGIYYIYFFSFKRIILIIRGRERERASLATFQRREKYDERERERCLTIDAKVYSQIVAALARLFVASIL